MGRYRDRTEAGRQLAGHLAHHHGSHPLVLGLAGGGMVVAAQVAAALDGSLDVVVAVPFGPPGNPDLSIGAVASDGTAVVEESLVDRLGLTAADLAAEVAGGVARARRRERALRRGRGPEVGGRTVLVVDDGVAGGVTLRAALGLVRRGGPALLVCAVPVGPPATVDLIAAEADEIVCPLQPLRFHAVGEWYEEYGEVGDDEVAALLEAGRS
ncbi:MAG: phosphoribosyltransferase family protein [Actinomycetota bacterium]